MTVVIGGSSATRAARLLLRLGGRLSRPHTQTHSEKFDVYFTVPFDVRFFFLLPEMPCYFGSLKAVLFISFFMYF